MSTSAIGSSNPYSYLQWPQTSGTDSSSSTTGTADTSGAPSDPLLALFNSATGGTSTGDPLLDSLDDGSSQGPTLPFSPETMSALFSAQGQQSDPTASSATSGQSLFAKFDADGDGSISQSEFEQAIGPGADQSKVDQLFNALDANGDGSISQNEMSSATQKAHGGGHHHHHAGGAGKADGSQQSDPLEQLLSGATTQADGTTSQSITNADGSTSTTLTYADGTTITMNSPAAATPTNGSSSNADNGSSGSSSNNSTASSLQAMLEKMISAQAMMFAPPSGLDVSI